MKHGAKVDSGEYTAVMSACYCHKPEVVAILLKHGANYNRTIMRKPDIPDGDTVLTAAVRGDCAECVKLLMAQKGLDVDKATSDVKDGATAVGRAVTYDRHEIAKLLMEKGADPNALKGPDKETPLQRACRDGETPTGVKISLAVPARLWYATVYGST